MWGEGWDAVAIIPHSVVFRACPQTVCAGAGTRTRAHYAQFERHSGQGHMGQGHMAAWFDEGPWLNISQQGLNREALGEIGGSN